MRSRAAKTYHSTVVRLGILAMASSVCLGPFSACASDAPATPRRIGLVIPLTGILAPQGNDALDAARVAVMLVNDAGGVDGAPIELVVGDDQSTREGATLAVAELEAAGVEIVIGSVGTPLTRAVAEAAGVLGLTTLAPSATGDGLRGPTEAASDAWPVLRLCTTQRRLSTGLITLATEQNLTRLGIIADPSSFGTEAVRLLTEIGAAQGVSVVATRQRTSPDDDPKLLAELFGEDIDGLVVAAAPEGGAAVMATLARNFTAQLVPVLLPESLATPGFVVQAGADVLAAIPHVGVAAADQGRWFSAFTARYSSTYGAAPRAFQAHVFDAVMLATIAMAAVESGQAALWSTILNATQGTLADPGAIQSAIDLARAGAPVDYDGASGPLSFEASGDVIGQVAIWRVVDGELAYSSPN